MQIIQSIQNMIYEIRGERVMPDFDLAALYETETKVFNQAVKRNIRRFPGDFMFQLTKEEYEHIKPQISALETGNPLRPQITASNQLAINNQNANRSQIVTGSQKHRSKDYLPYAFTEQGVAMLSGVLSSDKAIAMNIAIMRAFVEVRKILLKQMDLKEQINEIRGQVGNHDAQLSHIYDALENLLDEKAAQVKREGRERIGFKK